MAIRSSRRRVGHLQRSFSAGSKYRPEGLLSFPPTTTAIISGGITGSLGPGDYYHLRI
jgi:hypothetical protein